MADTGTPIPGLTRLGQDAEQVANLYPRPAHPAAETWKTYPVEIPAELDKLASGHCGYGN